MPILMQQIINMINQEKVTELTLGMAHQWYAKIHAGIAHIHPFWDGMGDSQDYLLMFLY